MLVPVESQQLRLAPMLLENRAAPGGIHSTLFCRLVRRCASSSRIVQAGGCVGVSFLLSECRGLQFGLARFGSGSCCLVNKEERIVVVSVRCVGVVVEQYLSYGC